MSKLDTSKYLMRGLIQPKRSLGQIRCAYDNMGDILVHQAIIELPPGLNSITYSKNSRIGNTFLSLIIQLLNQNKGRLLCG